VRQYALKDSGDGGEVLSYWGFVLAKMWDTWSQPDRRGIFGKTEEDSIDDFKNVLILTRLL